MRFKILGPLEVMADDDQPVAVSRRLHRLALCSLLLNAGRPCSVSSLTSALWPDRPPLSPEVSLRSCVYGIRKLLPDGQRLVTRPSGYLIRVSPGELDLHSFRRLVSGGRDALDSGDPERAAVMLAEATGLWREPQLADLPEVHDKDKLVDQHREAQDALMDARLALGQHRQVLAELRSAVAADPLREHAWAQLMTALYRCGARAEALAAFGRLRMTLVTTYGIEPGPELQDLHRQVLADDPALMRHWQPPASCAAAQPPLPAPPRAQERSQAREPRAHSDGRPAGATPTAGAVPLWPAQPQASPACQLPATVADFTGRAAELARLSQRMPSEGVAITVLSGMPGAGKTELAVHAAHLARPAFPDGQLCAWLDDAGTARDPQVVLGEMLRGLGVPANDIPGSRFERAAMYRSALAGRRVLVLADGAISAAQVRPLLPNTAGSALLVTSRARLADLDSAKTIEIGGMNPADAVSLLGKICGRKMTGANGESALTICSACGYLPLAVRIAGARLADDPDLSMTSLADSLASDGTRLDELSLGDQSVRARLASAAQSVDGTARTMLALLAAAGSSEMPGWLIATLLEDPVAGAIAPALANAGLLLRVPGSAAPGAPGSAGSGAPGSAGSGAPGGTRYRMHPLVRSYAGELLAQANPAVVGAATGRLAASGWLGSAAPAAHGLPDGQREHVPLSCQ